MTFGDLIKNKRIKKKIGLREFSRKVKLSPSFICSLEGGKAKPPKEKNIIKIAEILDIDKDLLLAKANKIPIDILNILISDYRYYYNFIRKSSK
jgi:transcriptional regulator with XRE-family HTH domain